MKLARPARDCARRSATVGARSCGRRTAKLAQEAKRGDPRQLREGGKKPREGLGGTEGGVAGLGGRSRS